MTAVPLEDIAAAAERIKDRVRRTPFIRARHLKDRPREGEILLKLENLQVTGSFKVRGANNAVLSLSDAEVERGVITASGGNHGLAVAYAAHAAGKARWVEKSPIHLLYLREVRRAFPRAPIVRIVRDPRDVALSLERVPWGPDSVAGGLLLWRRFDEASRRFFATDPLTRTVSYERLVRDPALVLEELCEFLGEEVE